MYKLIADIPEKDLEEVANFIGYLKMKREVTMFNEFSQASESSWIFGTMMLTTRYGTMLSQGDIVLIPILIWPLSPW